MPNQRTVLVLLSTDQFAFPLIRYLALEATRYSWKLCIASMFADECLNRIREEKFSTEPVFIAINDFAQCHHAVKKSQLVVAMVPDVMMLAVADCCITLRRTLITPARITRQMVAKKAEAEQNNVLLLFECGFSPGLDHVTAKKAIDTIVAKGGTIQSFKTYHGSQVVNPGLENPWQYKLTEPSVELLTMGKGNNRHIINGHLQQIPYHQVMERSSPLAISGMKDLVAIPEGDSLYYRKLYNLTEARSVLKAKLVRHEFAQLWSLIVRLGLTDTNSRVDLIGKRSFYEFLRSLLPYSESDTPEAILSRHFNASFLQIEQLKWLGLFSDEWIGNSRDVTADLVLKHLLEKKLKMSSLDRDCIIMHHALEYTWRNVLYNFKATLIAAGEGDKNSALAKAIGLTTGAAAKHYMLGNISVRGLHTPTKKEIYDPMLNELDDLGVTFHVEEKKMHETPVRLT